jgi:hypothetical protein
MDHELPMRRRFGARLNLVLDRAESIYLKVLRAMILIIASLLILYAAGLAAMSLYRIAQSPSSVEEAPATVAPEELTGAGAPQPRPGTTREAEINPAHRAAYDQFLRRYYQLYQSRFEPFRQRTDRRLSLEEFDDTFVNTGTRLTAAARGTLDFNADKADLEALFRTMNAAAGLPRTQERLRAYQQAQRVRVCRNVQRMRTTQRQSWDPYSTSCANWYYDMGCAVTRRVQTPYTERACEMRFPEGTQSHTQIFRAYQSHFYSLLNQRREANAAKAEAERFGIIQGIAEGKLDLMTALKVLGGFLILMFFFLLIAIERHQRLKTAAEERLSPPPAPPEEPEEPEHGGAGEGWTPAPAAA